MMRNVVTMILAGGKGTRLEPLTRDRAKPAVPFGGLYRIIDFPLSNCINSDLRRILVLTQYKARSLDRHIATGWGYLSRELDEYIDVLPPQQRLDEHWYKGTADAIYQNIYTIEKANPKYVLILAGDHIYKMDYGDMIRAHIEKEADLTVGCMPVPGQGEHPFRRHAGRRRPTASSASRKSRRTRTRSPAIRSICLASMGIYVFTARLMYELLCQDATKPDSEPRFRQEHHSGHDREAPGVRLSLPRQEPQADAYWRDVGTLDAYYQANMDLIEVDPVLNLYDREWPIRTNQPQLPPPKFVFREESTTAAAARRTTAWSARAASSRGGQVIRSILSPNVRINSFAHVEDSILFDGVDVGRGSPHSPGHHRQGGQDSRRTRPSATISNTTAGAASRSPKQGVVVIAKGESPETFKKP